MCDPADKTKARSTHAMEATNFFLADVQTGLGPFVAAYLAASDWKAGAVGHALTVAGIVTVIFQTPAGWIVDNVLRKRILLIAATIVLGSGALLLTVSTAPSIVYTSQILIGGTGPFLGPTLAAITMGIVGVAAFDRQFGRNQGFNSAGNLFAAGLIAVVSHFLGNRAIFFAAAVLIIPTIISTLLIRRDDIDPKLARGGCEKEAASGSAKDVVFSLLRDRVLLVFLACCFLFHLANAAMLPQLGEILAHGSARAAAPFMSGCIAVTQTVIMLSAAWIGRIANARGRKPLLLIGFGVLPLRALLYTVVHGVGALIAVQVLDGVANAIFGVVSILVVADRTRGTGRFNLTQGAVATSVALGAALSTTVGGSLMEHRGANVSFWVLGTLALAAFALLLFGIPETKIPTTITGSGGLTMSDPTSIQITRHNFSPLPVGRDGIVAYIHIGDIHMVERSRQNYEDLLRIVKHINQTFTGGLNFVYVPGDIADDGSRNAYSAVRECLDQLGVPWCGILGDHDVHEKDFANFREAISDTLYSSFSVGTVRFIRLNVFAEPRPDAFLLGNEQFVWLEGELQKAEQSKQTSVVLMHCYPSELKEGSAALKELLDRFDVRLVDMGHTHYNEVSNDGTTLYAATRSTGQIEEGNVGYSLVTLDQCSISWHFLEPKDGPIVVVTSPVDERLLTEANMEGIVERTLQVRACVWGDAAITSVTAEVDGKKIALTPTSEGTLWESQETQWTLPGGVYELTVIAEDATQRQAKDTVRIVVGRNAYSPRDREHVDLANALEAWEDRGLLGTQLGPNKNGRKW